MSVCLLVGLSSSVFLSVLLPVFPCACLSICLSICLSVCLFVFSHSFLFETILWGTRLLHPTMTRPTCNWRQRSSVANSFEKFPAGLAKENSALWSLFDTMFSKWDELLVFIPAPHICDYSNYSVPPQCKFRPHIFWLLTLFGRFWIMRQNFRSSIGNSAKRHHSPYPLFALQGQGGLNKILKNDRVYRHAY